MAPVSIPMTTGFSLPEWVGAFVQENAAQVKTESDLLRLAVQLSRENMLRKTGGPFGAVVYEIDSLKIISIGVNLVVPQTCSLLHGEIVALMLAEQRALKRFSLRNDSGSPLALATSSQPCCQCYGAIYWSGLAKIVYAASAEDVYALTGFDEGSLPEQWRDHLRQKGCVVEQGGHVAEARQVLKQYAKDSVIYNS